ncbi:DUF2029 domain-containing protein, partial [Dolichospermum sp. ST_sed3]|nr:DUF2029 domain-containing protein [Dolichospermum sp. ST_sed3]
MINKNKMEKSEKVLILSTIVLVGFVLAVVYHYILGYYLKLDFPENTFLWTPEVHFSDFVAFLDVIKNFSPFENLNFSVNYFPVAYILLFPFSLIKNKIIAYLLFSGIFVSFFVFMNRLFLKCENLTKLQNIQNIFILTFLSYPFLMLLDRGNFDMFLFILFAGFLYSFKSGKYLLSACILAVINAIKPFWLIFLILFLFKKRIKEIIFSLTITALLIIGGFMLLKGDFFSQLSVFLTNLTLLKYDYLYSNANNVGMFGSSSLFMALKLLFTRHLLPFFISTGFLVKIYGFLSLAITVAIIFFAYKEKTFWKQITLLTLYMLLVPYIIIDYKLIFLFGPLWLFLNSKEKSDFDLKYTILFGLLLIPKNIIKYTPWFFQGACFSASILINPLLIIYFMYLIISEQSSNK